MKTLGKSALRLAYRLHGIVGIASAVLVGIVCVSGSVAVYKPEIDRWTTAVHAEDVPRVPTEDAAVDEAVTAVEREHPGVNVTAIALPAGPASQVTNGPFIGMQGKAADGAFEFFCHPATGELLGSRPHGASWGQWIRDLHIRLFAGTWGRVFVGVLGVVMLVSTLSGLAIYYHFNGKRWLPRWRPRRSARITAADVHRASGLGSAVAAVLFASTGAVLAWPAIDPTHTYPDFVEGEPPARAEWAADLRSLAVRAEDEIPRTRAAFIVMPRSGDAAVRVYVDHPPRLLVRQLASSVTFDPSTGDVLHRHDASASSPVNRTFLAFEALHFGRFGGSQVLRLVWAIAGLLLGGVSLSGGVIWWLRRRKSKSGALKRGASMSASPPTITTSR